MNTYVAAAVKPDARYGKWPNGDWVAVDRYQALGLDTLRQNISVVFQEPLLFARSIRENLAMGKPDATDDELWGALEHRIGRFARGAERDRRRGFGRYEADGGSRSRQRGRSRLRYVLGDARCCRRRRRSQSGRHDHRNRQCRRPTHPTAPFCIRLPHRLVL